MRISDVKESGRHRREFGDLQGLAASLDKIGLLHPIVITGDGRLIAGSRRLAAAKLLGWTEIKATIARNLDDALLALSAERDENTCRKNLAPTEALALAEALEPLEKKAARQRQDEGRRKGGRKAGRGRPIASGQKKPEAIAKRARTALAAAVGLSASSLAKVRWVRNAASKDKSLKAVVEKMDRTGNINAAVKAIKQHEKRKELERAASSVKNIPVDLRVCKMEILLSNIEASSLDAIITDPPYAKEFIPLYLELARLAARALKPDGILAVMTGQSYLPEIVAVMTPEITYRWTLAYLTPGGQAVQLWDRKINTFWKPVLLFHGKSAWMGDVVHSNVNDNDKRFHEWGQSESGMARLVESLTAPGALVCDPFLGAGTVAVVSAALHRRFIGCDIDAEMVDQARIRVKAACATQ